LHAPNAYYGHASILKRYVGLPQARTLFAAIEHGPWIDDEIWDVDANTPLRRYLCASPERAAFFAETTGLPTTAIGPLIDYVPGAERTAPPGDGHVVLFPVHSSHYVEVQWDVDELLDQIADIDASRISACLYWRDAQRGLADRFAAAGIHATSAGHMYDADFLLRLRRILLSADLIVTNEIGTHVLYALHLGRPVWLVNQVVEYRPDESAGIDHLLQDMCHPRMAELERLLSARHAVVTVEQRSAAERLLGSKAHKSPADLRRILRTARDDYRLGVTPARRRQQLVRRERSFAGGLVAAGRSHLAARLPRSPVTRSTSQAS